jgi:hypothetical protein
MKVYFIQEISDGETSFPNMHSTIEQVRELFEDASEYIGLDSGTVYSGDDTNGTEFDIKNWGGECVEVTFEDGGISILLGSQEIG